MDHGVLWKEASVYNPIGTSMSSQEWWLTDAVLVHRLALLSRTLLPVPSQWFD